MDKEYINPLRKRHLAEYELMSAEQREQMDGYDELPKEERYIIPIKRKRKPEIFPGTIFAICLPSKRYVYGKILKKAENLPMIEDGYYIAMISNITTDNLQAPIFELSDNNILLGPWIISDASWKNGRFYTVSFSPITENENKLNIGFYKMKPMVKSEGKMIIDAGYFMDMDGNKIEKEPHYLDHCAYITIHGIEKELFKQAILGKI